MSSKKTGQNPDRGTGLQPKNCDSGCVAMSQSAIIVPCRLESTRFPRKLLHNIKGKPLLQWVAERISTQAPEFPLWFAVDHELLMDCLARAGFKAIMTSPTHQSGTDRLAEANRTVKADFIINVQADEPLVSGAQLRDLARLITSGKAAMATLATPFERIVDFNNPNQVKVVVRQDGRALYFSRSRLPFSRDLGPTIDDAWVAANPCLKHLGLYAYRADLLERFSSLPPGRYEQIERLEQLRVLENGEDILVGITNDPSIGVDTPEDAGRFEQVLDAGSNK
jgi:3-deoxy-manno-octulosonate cytidylyltransferase (CMP-KDO synthetase)